jgi:3-keto-disaccharide hydrolase
MTLPKRRNKPTRAAWTWGLGGAAVILILAAALSLGVFTETEESVDLLIDFHQYHYGAVPEEFDYDATGSNGPVLSAGRPFWRVYLDRFAPSPELVLIQAADLAEPDHYPIALLRDLQAKDVTLSAYLKPMGGTMDQSQGLIWRVQDKDNYYAVLANALDSQLHLLKIVDGQPQEIASAPIQIAVQFEQDAPTPTWGWYTLKVETEDSRIAVWFDGEKKLEVTDKTFMRSGKIGFITHADSVALFDDLSVQVGKRK